MKRNLHKSEVYHRLHERSPTETDLATYFGVVEKSHALFSDMYPNSQFHILLWNHRPERHDQIYEEFTARHLHVHSSNAFLPEFTDNQSDYQLNAAFDKHPTAEAHRRVAECVVTEILQFPSD